MVPLEAASEMKLLLDTHVFLLWKEAGPRLSRRVRQLLSDPANSLYLSVASAWEMTLKVQSGKLGLPAAAGQVERLRIVTHNPQVGKYHVETIW